VFFVFYGAAWLRQDCARPAISSGFFKNHSRRVYLLRRRSFTSRKRSYFFVFPDVCLAPLSC
jgi:hypothetical protein